MNRSSKHTDRNRILKQITEKKNKCKEYPFET